jgi:hypothetical protein
VRRIVVRLTNAYKLSDKNTALSFHVERRTIECMPSDPDLGINARLVKLYVYLVYFLVCCLTKPSVPKII